MASGDRQTSVNKLTPDHPNSCLIGIVIAKQEARNVAKKTSDQNDRFVLDFTFRDSPTDSLNVTCWGSENYIRELSDRLEIGDAVKIKHANIQFRNDDQVGRFRPIVSSPFQVTVSDSRGEIVPHEDPSRFILHLMHSPPKPYSSCCSLEDIVFSGQAMNEELANLLVAVRSIRSQNITAKDGRQLIKTELHVMDQTYPHFLVTLWGQQYRSFVQKWINERTVLFLSDVRLQYNTYHKAMVASVTSSTIITVEPALPEGRSLQQYAQTVRMTAEDSVLDNVLDTNDLASLPVYTIATLQHTIRDSVDKKTDTEFRGTIYCFISNFNIDGQTRITSLRCGQCKQQLRSPLKSCTNNECDLPPEEGFFLRIWLSDHTGTIQNCFLADKPCQNILGITVDQFERKTEAEKTQLKWTFLLERCKVIFSVFMDPSKGWKPNIKVISCARASPEEAARNLL